MFLKVAAALCYALSIAVFTVPAFAQRPIEIDIGGDWQHPHSGIVVPSELGGIERGQATEFSPDFLSIGFSYISDAPYDEISLYIYRLTSGDMPVWFAQARTAIEIRDSYKKPYLAFQPETFAWPGTEGWQGQRAIYATPDSAFSTSTGVALFLVNGWLVKMRASSAERSPEDLRNWMSEAFSELRPPLSATPQAPPIAVTDCPRKLEFGRKSKDARQSGSAALLGGLLSGTVVNQADEKGGQTIRIKPSVAWCRDASLDPMQVAYRANAASDAYLIALNDSGTGVSVRPDPASQALADDPQKATTAYAITLITDTQNINYVSQDRLPSPDRVLDIIDDGRVIGSVSTWGEDDAIEINSTAS